MGKQKSLMKNPLPPSNKMRAKRRRRSSHTVKLPMPDSPLAQGKKLAKKLASPYNTHGLEQKAQDIIEQRAEIYIPPPTPKIAEDIDFVPVLLMPCRGSNIESLISSVECGSMPAVLLSSKPVGGNNHVTVIESADPIDSLRTLFISAKVPYVVVMRRAVKDRMWLYKAISELINTKKSTIIYSKGGKLPVNQSTMILSRDHFVKSGLFFEWGWAWLNGVELK